MKKLIPILALLILLWSCQNKATGDKNTESEALHFSISELWSSDTTLKTPESVYYDSIRNVLYVANMNRVDEGEFTGFISKLATDGTIIELEWVSGLKEPRGMGMNGKLLFATDSDRIIVIDVESGELVKTVEVDSAQFLNDLAIDADGVIYFSDSQTGKIHKCIDGEVSIWLDQIEGPNGLYDKGEFMIIGASGEGEVWKVNKESGEREVIATGLGIDGIEYTGIEKYYIMSEWGGTIQVVSTDTVQNVLDTREQKINTADIGYNLNERIIYVPTFYGNQVVAYKLETK